MSVTLTSIKEVLHDEAFDGKLECAEPFDIDNTTFSEICKKTKQVKNWNGNHDPLCFSPTDLFWMADANPEYAKALNALGEDGGAVLS
jgi:hypothetical protein